jgi:hypothetical protein
VITSNGVSFGVALDKPAYTANLMPPVAPAAAVPKMEVRLSLRVKLDDPLTLTFGSGQTYDIVVRDEKGVEVYRWSKGKAFTMALRSMAFQRGEKIWAVSVPMGENITPWPAGRYTVEAWLTTMGAERYAGSATCELRYVY